MGPAQGGDKTAYREFLSLLYPYIKALVSHKLGRVVDVEDLTQECLIGVHKNLSSYHPDKPFKPWLSAIIRYKIIDYFRYLEKKKEHSVNNFEEHVTNVAAPTNEPVNESSQLIVELLGKLPENLRRALQLTQLEGLEYKEAAEKEGISEQALRKRISRAYKQLRVEVSKIELSV